MTKLEECPKCGNTGFLVARDMIATRHCCKCQTTWEPEKPCCIRTRIDLNKEIQELQTQFHEGYEWSSKEIGKRDDQLASAADAIEGLLDRQCEESIRRAQEVLEEIRDEEVNDRSRV